jgi:DNA-binding transcriptional ArsR family regulator
MNHSLNKLVLANGEIPVTIDYLQTKKAALILRALNHNLRCKILELLDEHKRMPVTQIYKKLRIEQSVASQHLAILRHAGMVITERKERQIYYSPNYNRIDEFMKIVEVMYR